MPMSFEPLAARIWAVRSGPDHHADWHQRAPYDACGVARALGSALVFGPWRGPIPPAAEVKDAVKSLGCDTIAFDRLRMDGSSTTFERSWA